MQGSAEGREAVEVEHQQIQRSGCQATVFVHHQVKQRPDDVLAAAHALQRQVVLPR